MLDEFISFEEKQAADGVLAYRALGRPSAVQDREAVSVALNHLLSRRTLRFTKATYTDLIGTGNVRLIRNGGLRDRIVGLYEGNDRLAAIIDRNNQSFVDQMYAMYLMDTALVVIRPSSNLPILDATLKDLAASAGAIVSVADDRLWKLPPDSQVWDVLRARLWMRTFVSFQAIRQARGVTEQVTAVRQAVIDELARRWPGDTVPPARASAP
jgi:hypothetical protein